MSKNYTILILENKNAECFVSMSRMSIEEFSLQLEHKETYMEATLKFKEDISAISKIGE